MYEQSYLSTETGVTRIPEVNAKNFVEKVQIFQKMQKEILNISKYQSQSFFSSIPSIYKRPSDVSLMKIFNSSYLASYQDFIDVFEWLDPEFKPSEFPDPVNFISFPFFSFL